MTYCAANKMKGDYFYMKKILAGFLSLPIYSKCSYPPAPA